MRNRLRRFRAWLARSRTSSSPPYRYELTEDGSKIVSNPKSKLVAMLRWGDVHTIEAYVRDVFAFYEVCLAFEVDQEKWIEIHEGDENFAVVAGATNGKFPGVPADWYDRVKFNTPQSEPLELYRRQ